MKNVKFCFAINVVVFLISANLFAQDFKQWRVDKEIDSAGYHLIIVKNDLKSERLGFGFGFKINVEDFYFPDSNIVCIVWESPIHFGYYKLKKNEDDWELEISGSLGTNNQSITSAPIPGRDTRPRSVKILEEDIVLIKRVMRNI